MLFIVVGGCLDSGKDDGAYLVFSSSECDINPFNYSDSELGVQDIEWIDNTTVKVTAAVITNCGLIIRGGDFSISNGDLMLTCDVYNPHPGAYTDCNCGFELTYTLYNMTEQLDTVKLDRYKYLE